MRVKMERSKWILVVSLHLAVVLVSEVILLASAGPSVGHSNAVLPLSPYNSLSTKEALQRRLLKGREVIPAMSSNAIPGEPSCEELRAMWRYYKRQSRAELTNEIPRFGNPPLFWDILPVAPQQPQISSFGPLKGRLKNRLRMKNPKSSPVYGRVVYKPDKERERERARKPRPMEEIAKLMGKPKNDRVGGASSQEPIVHLSPPATPTKASSLQQIKEVFREERIREKGPAMRNNDDNGNAFGRIILSPPRGMDGRVANKPRELMTPFEKIRFGHADDILDDGTRPNLNLMAKRRTLPLPVLKQQIPYFILPRQSRRDTIIDQPLIWTQRDLLVDNDMPQSIDDQSTDGSNPDWISFPNEEDDEGDDNNNNEFGMTNPSGLMMIVEPFQNPGILSPPEIPLSMETSKPTCTEVEGQPCKLNSDCSCVGFGLYRCYIDQCQVISLETAVRGGLDGGNLNDKIQSFAEPGAKLSSSASSFWHTTPLQRNQLGLWEETNRNAPGTPDNNNDDEFTRSFNTDKRNTLSESPSGNESSKESNQPSTKVSE